MDVPEERRAKLERLRAAGREPFPAGATLPDRRRIAEALAGTDPDAAPRAVVTVAGRVTARRDHGSSQFLDLRDESGRVQVYVQKKVLGEGPYAQLLDTLDLGDFLAARGELGRTRLGEVTVFAQDAELLTKTLSQPANEYFGVADVELRYRQRYVDLVANPGSAARFRARCRMVDELRAFLRGRGFLEVETPMLHAIAGGATARPFITHHNTLDIALYLRIAPELFLKRLLVGGFERVFEIGRNFRNEGLSPRHNPEFTMLEAYWAYARAGDWMAALEELLPRLAETCACDPQGREAPGGPRVRRGEAVIDFTPPFKRGRYADLIKKETGVDVMEAGSLRKAAQAFPVPPGSSDAAIADFLFSEHVEPKLGMDPFFVTDFPLAMSPLAKRSPEDPRLAERFELFIGGMEAANAFSELNDPEDQLRRFEEQVARKDPELPAQVDHDYVDALAHGMPPAAGIGIGVDRLAMLLTGAESIRDVILFPLLRPQAGA
ncbi:MAG TPA: lysine--tRNA ligase [Planctomycetota bacterium]|nr:lysine--tRNA ligase [Planctomycetota bacterium]